MRAFRADPTTGERAKGEILAVSGRFLVLNVFAVVVIATMVTTSIFALSKLRDQSRSTRVEVTEIRLQVAELVGEIGHLAALESEIVLAGSNEQLSASALAAWNTTLADARDTVMSLSENAGGSGEFSEEMYRLDQALDDYAEKAQPLLVGMGARSMLSLSELSVVLSPARPFVREVDQALHEAVDQLALAEIDRDAATDRRHGRSVVWLIGLGILAALISLIASVLFHRSNMSAFHRVAKLRLSDPLTGLMNREGMRAAISRTGSSDGVATIADDATIGMVTVDIDYFQTVNETAGNAAGDQLLRDLATEFASLLKDGDLLARIGSNEFAVLLNRPHLAAVEAVAQQMLERVRAMSFLADGEPCRITATAGVCALSGADVSFDEMVATCEAALYLGKESGRDRSATLVAQGTDDISIRGQMRKARRVHRIVEAGGLWLACQEIVPLDKQGDFTSARADRRSCEVLLRATDPETGALVPACDIIEPTEKFGSITMIDEWVVSAAVRLMDEGRLDQYRRVGVNLSGKSIDSPAFEEFVADLLRRYPDQANRLCFEITETSIIHDLDRASAFISTMRRLGAEFAMDDFGTGAASFAVLRRLQVDTLKIDGQFIEGVLDNPTDREVIASLVRVARTLKITTVAERVETAVQAQALAWLGVDYIQGFVAHVPTRIQERSTTGQLA